MQHTLNNTNNDIKCIVHVELEYSAIINHFNFPDLCDTHEKCIIGSHYYVTILYL